MKKINNKIFVSLFWKAILVLAIILAILVSFFTYFNVEQLKNLQSHQRSANQQQYIIEYNGLLKKTAIQLINLIDGIPQLQSQSQTLESKLNQHWISLQITWGLESAALLDDSGNMLAQWGNKSIYPSAHVVQRVISSGSPIEEMRCSDLCQLAISAPVLSVDGKIRVIQISVSLADTLLDFQRITQTDIGLLTPVLADKEHGRVLAETGMSFSALTNRALLQNMVHDFAIMQNWKEDFIGLNQQQVYIINTKVAQYELMLLSEPDFTGNNAIVVFISDTTTIRDQIEFARHTHIITGLLAILLSIVMVVLVLWKPIRSLQKQSKALPLLPQGKYNEAREQLNNIASNVIFADEITQLQSTSLQVTNQLENFHKELTQNTQKLFEMAHFDGLTGLINRTYLTYLVDQKLSSDDEREKRFSLIYLDLDNFKHINDALGHLVGDNLLSIVASRLKSCVGALDLVARTGGDEFCLVITEDPSDEYVTDIAKRVLDVLQNPIAIDGRTLAITTSIGITFSLVDGISAASLLQNADLAMYQAKASGRNKYHIFNHQLHKDADSRMALEEELRRAVEQEEFVLYFQPQIDLKTGKLIGCEALIRWQHPSRGLLAPFFFIDTLENNGLIIPVGKWVIREACRQCRVWNNKGLKNIKVSINLSARQFNDPDLIIDIQSAIQKYKISPEQLEFEVTESLLATDIQHAIELLKSLQSLGSTIAIDDFGTGYSSLNYIKRLPLDKLKIDRAFIKDLPDDNDDKQITAAIIVMAHTLNLKVVAEGVETKEQMHFLQSLSCEIGQGYLFDKPISAEEFEQSVLVKNGYLFN
jgi:diguanylate cyclase (GGDEF)-like protein